MEIRIKETNATFEYGDIKQINIYGDGEIKYTIDQGYLEEYHTRNNVYTSVYDGRVQCMYLSKEPVRALKLNLNRKDNFYMKHVGKYSFESGKALYVHESEIHVTNDGEKLAMQTDEEKNYLAAFTLENQSGFLMRRCHIEEVKNAGPDWKIPDGGKWGNTYGTENSPCYDVDTHWKTGETRVLKRWCTFETITKLQTAQRFYVRTEYSENRIRAKEIAKKINENKVFYKDVSFYEIEKLLTFFDLVEK